METALLATAGSGPYRVGICAEYDALPGLGHACGHNLIAALSAGTALALAPFADDLGLTVEGHRDIKPDNLFELDGQPAIGDFGLVK